MKNPKSVRSLLAFQGFTAASKLLGVFGDRYARVIQLKRRKKRPSVGVVVSDAGAATTVRQCVSGICQWRAGEAILSLNAGVFAVPGVMACT